MCAIIPVSERSPCTSSVPRLRGSRCLVGDSETAVPLLTGAAAIAFMAAPPPPLLPQGGRWRISTQRSGGGPGFQWARSGACRRGGGLGPLPILGLGSGLRAKANACDQGGRSGLELELEPRRAYSGPVPDDVCWLFGIVSLQTSAESLRAEELLKDRQSAGTTSDVCCGCVFAAEPKVCVFA